eukprot:2698262-Pleurochrysis_carterae.AAC.1
MRWIGREVKRFLREAAVHLPFLLRVAAVPDGVFGNLVENETTGVVEVELAEDEELEVTVAELEQEEQEEPQMLEHAAMWDHFLDYVEAAEKPWAEPDLETDVYTARSERCNSSIWVRASMHAHLLLASQIACTHLVHAFAVSSAAVIATDIYTLNTKLADGWVLHVLCFVVTRHTLKLGDPTRRSCDACESFGAMLKKMIKHLTCRRRINKSGSLRDNGKKEWLETFRRGYTEQAFRCVCARADLIHGKANVRYMQRTDYRLKNTGRAAKASTNQAEVTGPLLSIVQACSADTVLTSPRRPQWQSGHVERQCVEQEHVMSLYLLPFFHLRANNLQNMYSSKPFVCYLLFNALQLPGKHFHEHEP